MKNKSWSCFFILCCFTTLFARTPYQTDSTMSSSNMDHHNYTMNAKSMHGAYGYYPMNRDSSGTSWQPESTPITEIMLMTKGWMLMFNGFANIVYDKQGGSRGANKVFSNNMFMFMAQKDLGIGMFGFHSMVSLEPLMGKSGYPLLLQTGETSNGITPLIDRQHPHDLFMELAATYSIPLSDHISIFGYAGLPGEPALGPPTFMNRWSAMYIPEAPLSHHWLDSTHITYGVTTLGFIWNKVKFEVSAFKGREPDQFRWNIESAKLNSNSFRLSYNPNENWSLQISRGHIVSPEQLHPNMNTNRSTVSAIYNRPFIFGNWQMTFAWGQNANNPGHILDDYLLESTLSLQYNHTFFGRFENIEKDELLHNDNSSVDDIFRINKLSLGYIYNFSKIYTYLQPSVGGLLSTYLLPRSLKNVYGNSPVSFMLFCRFGLE